MAHPSRVVGMPGRRRGRSGDDASRLQAAYYSERAKAYESSHVVSVDEHFVALGYIDALMGQLGVRSVLDIGTGTGRSIRFLQERRPYQIVGLEPVAALLQE